MKTQYLVEIIDSRKPNSPTKVDFSNWKGAVCYACSFTKSDRYTVNLYNKDRQVSYYSNQVDDNE